MPLDFNSLVEKQEPSKDLDFNSLVEQPLKKKSTPLESSVTPSKLPSQDKFQQGLQFAQEGFKSNLGSAIQKDKVQGSNIAGLYNTLVGSLSSLAGGSVYLADILAAPAPLPLNVRVANAEADRKKVTEFIEKARSSKSSREFEQQQGAFDLAPKEGQGIFSGVDLQDIKGLAFQAPKTLAEMALGGVTGGYSFFSQSINDNARELEDNPNSEKMSDLQKVGYLFTQATAQAALEKFSIDKILKNTGLSKAVEKKIAKEVIDEFSEKGIKATAKQIEDAMFSKAAKLSNKIKNVGVKGLESAVIEGGTEGIQQAASDGIKLMTNKIVKDQVFDEEDINNNFWKNVINSSVMGAAMGGATGAGLQGLNSTSKAIRQDIANNADLQEVQNKINTEFEKGNLTPQEAEAANITAQQYADIAGKIPANITPVDKYKIIGGIEQRNKLQEEVQKARDEMSQLDPVFRKEKQDQIDLLQAKIEETNNYLEGIVSGKPIKYKQRNGMYFKVDSEGNEIPVSKETYDLSRLIREEDARNQKSDVEQFADRIIRGEKMESPEDLQFYENNKKEIEKALKAKADETKPTVIMPEENIAPEVIEPTRPAVVMPEENIPAETTVISPEQQVKTASVIMPEANVIPEVAENIKVEEVKPEIKSKLEAFKTQFAPQPKEITISGAKAAETRRINQEAGKIVPMEEKSAVLSWLAGKGSELKWEAINEAAGKVEGARLNVGRDLGTEEVKSRDYAAKDRQSGVTLDKAAHDIWEDVSKRNPNVKIEDVKNELLNAIRENPTRAEAAKTLVSSFGGETKAATIEEGEKAFYEGKGEQPTQDLVPVQFEGGFVPFEDEGDLEEAPFAVQEGITPEVQAMQDIVKDYINEGTTSLPEIKKAIAKQLGYNTKQLRQTIDDAYSEYTKTTEAALPEVKSGLLGRIGNAFNKMFDKEAQKPYIAKDGKTLEAKAKNVAETGGRVSFQATLGNGETVTAKPVDASIVNGFYSPLELQINQMKQDKMPAKQWLDKLRGEEAKWTGLADWLSQQDGSLTKENIKNWLQDNQIEINEIIKGEPNIEDQSLWKFESRGDGQWTFNFERGGYFKIDASEGDGFARLYVQNPGSAYVNEIASFEYYDRGSILDMALEKAYFDDYLEPLSGMSSTKYGKYTLDGEKSDYKEILITYPTQPSDITFEEWNKNRESWGNEKGTLEEFKKQGVLYKSSHFDEKNILVHVRSDIRTDSKGNKIFFIEEVQSDWGQEGKKKGFSEATLKEIERYNELKSVIPILEDAYRDIHRVTNYAYKYDVSTSAEEFYKLSIEKRKNKINETHEKYQSRTNSYIDFIQKSIDDRNKKISNNTDEVLLLEKKEYQLSKFLESVKNNKDFNQANKELDDLDKKIRSIERESVKLEEENITDEKMISKLNIDKSIDNFEYEYAIRNSEITFDKNEYAKITKEYQDLTDKIEKSKIKKAPFVTKTNDWAKLGLKVALKNAVQAGATKIAWTNGEQQNERYDLSKQVNYIERIPENDINKEQGDFYLDINLPNGLIGLNVNKDSGIITRSTGSIYRGDVIGKPLSDVIGKDMADKIMQGGAKKYEGDGLKIGGKGMKGFYGSPKENSLGILGDLAKSLYKQTPEKLILDNYREEKLKSLQAELDEYTANKTSDFRMRDFYLEEAQSQTDKEEKELMLLKVAYHEKRAKNNAELEESVLREIKRLGIEYQYSIDITPELKAQVEVGLPLFMANPSGTDILGFSFANRMYLNGEKLNPNTIIHEAGHIWTEWVKNNDYNIYAKGMELVEKSPYLLKAKNSKFYQEQAAKLATEQEKQEYFKHEALAMAIGDKGAQFVVESKKASFKDWLKTLWSKIKNLTGFKDLTAEEFQNLTFEEFSKMAVKEILGVENNLDKFNAFKSFRSKKNFVKANLKYESNKNAIDELDFTEEDLVKIVKANFDLSTFKNIKNAVQERSAKKVLQRPQGGVGEGRGGRKRVEPRVEGEEVAPEGKVGEATQPEGITQIPEEIENVGLDNQDIDYVGITESDLNKLRKSLGLPKYQGLPTETHTMLQEIAQEMIKKGVTIQSLYDKIIRGDNLTNYENAFMAEYRAALDMELKKNPSRDLLDKIKEFTDTFQVGASLAGKALESLKIMKKLNEANTLSNFLLSREEDKGFALTGKMIAEETARFEKLQEAKAKLEESANVDALEQIKNEVKKEPKKSREEYVQERKEALAAAREALRKLRSGEEGLMVSVPGLNELIAVAPHMNKYVKSLYSEGVSKLDDIVTEVHKEFSQLIDGLTKRDVLDVITGKYTTKRRTINEVNAGLRLLRREADLLLQLEKARKNEEEAENSNQIAKITRRIQELERKIKEVRELNRAKEMSEEGVSEKSPSIDGKTDKEYNERRQKFLNKKIKQLEDDLKNKKFDKEPAQAPTYKISDRTKKMMDRVVELEKEIAVARYKDQQAKLSKWEKAWDKMQSVLGLRRIIQTSIDASIWFRQLAKLTMNPRKWDIAFKFIKAGSQSIFSQKNYDRLMYEIHKAPDFEESVKDGIKYNELGTPNEMFPKSFLFEVPILREPFLASQRIADGSLNVARYELYNKYKRQLLKDGITRESDPEMYKAMSKLVMNSTGSGNMLKFFETKEGQKAMGALFYGAKLMAANINTLNPVYYAKMPKEVRREAMKDLASYTATVMSVVLAAVAAGGKVSFDPDEPEFLQVRFGEKVYDFTAGQAAYIRTFLRMVEAGYARAAKSKFEAKEASTFAWNSTLNFFRNKLAPNNAYLVNAIVGKNSIGEDFDPMEVFHVYPMYADDAYEAAKEDGFVSLLTVLLPNIIGVGYSSYYSDRTMKPMDEIIERAKTSDEMEPKSIREDITMEEFKEFAKLRDKLIEEKIKELYKEGIFDAETGEQIPVKKATSDQLAKEIIKLKREATTEAKNEFNADNEE